ncbi:uncharacterized protein I303_102570 [Kwoniella dejecticola CBS 10117]|uniref:Uncharacterized protein n=1 Tax=Kwoniella dejecticola CBS 10117 TaxID=1296121 RepID=A0A1A6A943_9TREE|nr:uncharacterized protein I303_02584 [Kwoniella dejecticola CBS 10117]OBR86576.1 hypothetical protein I303_02584 [Kwoniella dejecticola CBS 10117]
MSIKLLENNRWNAEKDHFILPNFDTLWPGLVVTDILIFEDVFDQVPSVRTANNKSPIMTLRKHICTSKCQAQEGNRRSNENEDENEELSENIIMNTDSNVDSHLDVEVDVDINIEIPECHDKHAEMQMTFLIQQACDSIYNQGYESLKIVAGDGLHHWNEDGLVALRNNLEVRLSGLFSTDIFDTEEKQEGDRKIREWTGGLKILSEDKDNHLILGLSLP